MRVRYAPWQQISAKVLYAIERQLAAKSCGHSVVDEQPRSERLPSGNSGTEGTVEKRPELQRA